MLLQRRAPVTYALLAILLVMFVIEGGVFGPVTLDRMVVLGAEVKALVLQGQWWRVVTAMFLHFSWLHILANGWSLLLLGALVEPMVGSGRFTIMYMVSGIFGGILTLAFATPMTVAAGASGAIFGVLGGLLGLSLMMPGPERRQWMNWAIIIFVLNIAYDLFSPEIGIWDHLGGFAAGFLMAFILGFPGRGAPRQRYLAALALAAYGIIAVLAA